ncbi:hypothetical protein ACO0QE_001254 [Hanseniaspora vineae]
MSSTTTATSTATSTITSSAIASSSSSDFQLYRYQPKKGLAYVASILFGLWTVMIAIEIFVKYVKASHLFKSTTSYNLNRGLIKKTLSSVCFKIYIPLIIGAMMEIGGYISRIFSSKDRYAKIPYIAQSLLILVAPGMISATIYMLFHRMIKYLNVPDNSRVGIFIKDSLLVKVFVAGDIISFFLQAGGGGIMSKESTVHTGEVIIIIGLIVQLVSFGIFLFVQLHFTLRYKNFSKNFYYLEVSDKWKYLNYSLFAASIFILIRSIVRVAEFVQGFDGFIASHEAFLYIFDGLAMLLTLVVVSISFLFTDIGEMFYQHFTITYAQNETADKDFAYKTETSDSYD